MSISIGFIAVVIIAVFVSYLLKMHLAFYDKVVGNICIKQKLMTSTYSLNFCSNDKLLVDNINGWIIEDGVIYGAFDSASYFSFEFNGESVSTYDSLIKMNAYLRRKGLQSYDMNREENIYHLLYSNGRNRKY